MRSNAQVVGGNVSDARYDRQIRLWGKQGQQALHEANIVAIGATVAVCEALKSIILTGVRSVTVVDERTVTPDDVAKNFFLSMDDIGASLAQRVVRQLCELNSECAGYAVDALNPAEWVEMLTQQVHAPATGSTAPGTLEGNGVSMALRRVSAMMEEAVPIANIDRTAQGHDVEQPLRLPSLILVSNRYPDWSGASPLVGVAAKLLNVPVVVVESRGLAGYLQTFARHRVVVYPHPPSNKLVEDLRIFEPFPELKRWFDKHDPDDCGVFKYDDPESLNAHSHLPYICILYHAYQRYQLKRRRRQQGTEAGGAAKDCPSPSDPVEPLRWPLKRLDYEALRAETRLMQRRDIPPQEGFQEALDKCTVSLNRALTLPPSVISLFADARTQDPTVPFRSAYGWELLGDDDPLTSSLPSPQECNKRPRVEGADASGSAALAPLPDTDYLLSWFIAAAIKSFYEESGTGDDSLLGHRVLPFCGHVPDFVTLTPWFQELREIYQRKHEADVEDISARVRSHLNELSAACGTLETSGTTARTTPVVRDAATGGCQLNAAEDNAPSVARLKTFLDTVTTADIARLAKGFVSNVWSLCPLAFSPGFTIDHESYAATPAEATGWHGETDRAHAAWRVVLRRQARKALGALVELGNEYGGEGPMRACGVAVALYIAHEAQRRDLAMRADGPNLFLLLRALVEEEGTHAWPLDDEKTALLGKLCWEVERVGHAEAPSVAAVMGALAAQEAIKLIQRRRVPATYPMVYSGIDGIFYNPPGTA